MTVGIIGAGNIGQAVAKRLASAGIDRLGFVAIDLGDFEMGRRLQQFPGGPLAGINMVQFP